MELDNRSLTFSEIELEVNGQSTTFLAPGIPVTYEVEELDEYIDFTEEFDEQVDVNVAIRSFSVGSGESDIPSYDDLEYISKHREELEDEYGIELIQSENFSIEYVPDLEDDFEY